jgi:hypothetical protein
MAGAIQLRLMGSKPTFSLIDVLRATVASIEDSRDVPLDDPALQELRGSLVRAIAELTLLRDKATIEPVTPPSGAGAKLPSIEIV